MNTRNERQKKRIQERRLILARKMGNRCSFENNGDCAGPLQFDHIYGHAGDHRPWSIGKYEHEWNAGRLRLLCAKHNLEDGIQRRIIANRWRKRRKSSLEKK